MCYSSNVMISCCRCFTFGIGSGASSALVRGIARAGNGSAEFIADNERMQSKVCIVYMVCFNSYFCGISGFRQWSRLTVVSRSASKRKTCTADNNDVTTTRKDFTGTNVVQFQPSCNSPIIYVIPLIL